MAETGAGFGYKVEWLAVHLQSAETVAAALGLGLLSPATWEDAVAAAYADQWLVTPSIDGWTLAASRGMPTPERDLFEPWLAGLSASLRDRPGSAGRRVGKDAADTRAGNAALQRLSLLQD